MISCAQELTRRANSACNVPSKCLPGQTFGGIHKPTKPRLLICAPSNAAVDEIIRRLLIDRVINFDRGK